MTVNRRPKSDMAQSGDAEFNSRDRQRLALVILGMHRSGTSALTGALGELGLAMPKHPIGVDDNNPTGHWEPEPLVRLHDQMLVDAGSRWDDWRSFDPCVLGTGAVARYKSEIAALIDQEFGDAPFFALKDPRLCRMIPLYEDVLLGLGIEPRYLLVYRNPSAVVASLARRDQMTSGFAKSMWLRHVLDAEAATRGRSRSIHSYEAFLADWRSAALRISEELKVRWPNPIEDAGSRLDSLLSQDHNHYSITYSEPKGDDLMMELVDEAYKSLLSLSTNESDARARSMLDRVKEDFDEAVEILGSGIFPELAAREKRLSGLADVRQYHIDRLTSEGVAKDEMIDRLNLQCATKEATIESLRRQLANIRSSSSWRITRPIRAAIGVLKNRWR